MTNLKLTRPEVRHRVELISNSNWNHPNETFHPTPTDFDKAAAVCWELLEKVRAEPNDRYKVLRLRVECKQLQPAEDKEPFKVYDGGRTLSPLTPTEEQAARINQIARCFLQDLDPKNEHGILLLNDLEELQIFYPDVAASMDLVTNSYQDWSLGKFAIKTQYIRSYGQAWGARIATNSPEYTDQIGKTYSVTYLPRKEWNKIEAKQRELAEQYVETTLAAYRRRHQHGTGHLPPDNPILLETLELYKRAFTDKDFAGLMTFAEAGSVITANGATYTHGPRNWKNELLDLWDWVNGSKQLEYYHYAPAELLRTMHVWFEVGDAEALFRFCKELEQPPSTQPQTIKPKSKRRNIRLELLEAMLSHPNEPASYPAIAEAVPKKNKGERTIESVGRERAKFESGEVKFTPKDIELIVNKLGGEVSVVNIRLLRAVRSHQTTS